MGRVCGEVSYLSVCPGVRFFRCGVSRWEGGSRGGVPRGVVSMLLVWPGGDFLPPRLCPGGVWTSWCVPGGRWRLADPRDPKLARNPRICIKAPCTCASASLLLQGFARAIDLCPQVHHRNTYIEYIHGIHT